MTSGDISYKGIELFLAMDNTSIIYCDHHVYGLFAQCFNLYTAGARN